MAKSRYFDVGWKLDSLMDWYAIPLRLIVGYGFMEHGYAKLARGPDAFIVILHALGVPFPTIMAWATIAVELLGGLLVLLGAFITLASIPMAGVLLVAIFTVHLPNGFSSIKLLSVDASGMAHFGQPGYETDLLYLAALAALVLGGCSRLSVDRLLYRPDIASLASLPRRTILKEPHLRAGSSSHDTGSDSGSTPGCY